MSLLKTTLLSLVVLVFSFAGTLFLYQALAFTVPGSAPPLGNIPLPLNVSSNPQTKTGPLGANTFYDANNSSYFFKPSGTSILGGILNLSNNRIKNVQDPIDSQDVATKAYVDSVSGGIKLKGWFDMGDAHAVLSFWPTSFNLNRGLIYAVEIGYPLKKLENSFAFISNNSASASQFCREVGSLSSGTVVESAYQLPIRPTAQFQSGSWGWASDGNFAARIRCQGVGALPQFNLDDTHIVSGFQNTTYGIKFWRLFRKVGYNFYNLFWSSRYPSDQITTATADQFCQELGYSSARDLSSYSPTQLASKAFFSGGSWQIGPLLVSPFLLEAGCQ
jgi:hypothetical protein